MVFHLKKQKNKKTHPDYVAQSNMLINQSKVFINVQFHSSIIWKRQNPFGKNKNKKHLIHISWLNKMDPTKTKRKEQRAAFKQFKYMLILLLCMVPETLKYQQQNVINWSL